MLGRIRAWLKSIVIHDTRVIIAAPIETRSDPRAAQEPDDGDCVVIETPGDFAAIAREIPKSFSHARLRKAVEQGAFLLCVRRPSPGTPGKQIVAYRMCERGVFQAHGMRKRISPQFVFIHYVEVLPEYRGKRIAGQLRDYLQEYARSRGIRWSCGVVSVTNPASLAAHLRAQQGSDPRVVGKIEVLHFFGGRFALATPWWGIKKSLDELIRRRSITE